MPRVIPSDVRAIRPTTMEPLPFIITAHALTDSYLLTAGLSEVLLTEIERWWSAHLMEIAQAPIKQKRLGNTSVTLDSPKLGDGLKGTAYGQQVLTLDPTGTLAAAVLMKRASIFVD